MGFSLEGFFADLEFIMQDNSLDTQQRLVELEDCIRLGKKYAEECGCFNR
jgi:hypothetical protein